MPNPLVLLVALLILLGGFMGGGYTQRYLRPYLDEETIGKQYLGEAECMRFSVMVPGPGGIVRIGEQVLCGYHLEWSNIVGGNAEPQEFAPDPGKSNL